MSTDSPRSGRERPLEPPRPEVEPVRETPPAPTPEELPPWSDPPDQPGREPPSPAPKPEVGGHP